MVRELDPNRLPAAIRAVRRGAVVAGGFTVLAIGVALLVLPGPGIPVVIGGLAILATEFVWAKRWMKRLQELVTRRPSEEKNTPTSKPDPPAGN